MENPQLPPLGDEVKFLGSPDGPEERQETENGIPVTILWARYRVQGLEVSIGWTVGYLVGTFRDPDRLLVGFDAAVYAEERADEYPASPRAKKAFDGISTSFLRALPMAHARALMRDRHEQLSVAELREEWTPLPSRVDSDWDYVHVAAAYVALGSTSVEPIKRLKDWSGESVETWGARLKRARARGILKGTGRDAYITPEYLEQANEIKATIRAGKGAP